MSETPAPTLVEMSYEGVENTIHVPAARVARYEGRGWERVTAGDTDKPYSKWLKADLETEVARRNAERAEDDQLDTGAGTVADLAAALTADDADA